MAEQGGQTDDMQEILAYVSEEERRFIALYAAQPEPGSAIRRFLGHVVFYLPGILVGIYGVAVQSFQAVTIAFLILVTNLFWSLAGVFKEQRSLELTQLVFRRMQAIMDARRRD